MIHLAKAVITLTLLRLHKCAFVSAKGRIALVVERGKYRWYVMTGIGTNMPPETLHLIMTVFVNLIF